MSKKLLILLFSFIFILSLCSCSADNKSEQTNNISENALVPNEEQKIEIDQEYKLEPSGISFYEAQEQGGFFILKVDGSFVPLCNEVISQRYSRPKNLFMMDGTSEKMVYLCENEELVLFSNTSVMDKYYLLPVLEEGYTVPFSFYESNDGIYFLNYCFRNYDGKLIMDYDDYQIVDVLSHFGKGINEEIRVRFNNANGIDAKTFYDSETIDLENYCTASSSFGCSSDMLFFTENFNESVTVDFYSGTQYCEETFYADIKCYLVDGCEKTDFRSILGERYYSGTAVTPEFTKEGYVILDTSTLENGKYVIANVDKREIFEINR